MIPFDFAYCRAETAEEAVAAFLDADGKGLNPMYYGGGTEIITMARAGSIRPGVVIDIKDIPECRECRPDGGQIIFGAAVTLSAIRESNLFPLLGRAAGRIADHTVQCKLTLGGNLAGTILYREAALPLLLAGATLELVGPSGARRAAIGDVFDRRLELKRGEFLTRVAVGREFAALPYVHAKKTPVEKIGYPVATVCALKKDGRIRVAMSGVCDYPFRSEGMESALNCPDQPVGKRAGNAIRRLPSPVLSDGIAAAGYREFVLYHALVETLETLEA